MRPPTRNRDRTAYTIPAFKEYKAWLRSTFVYCSVRDHDGPCYRRALTPDHVPPIATVANPKEWRGTFRPMCAYHSRRQSGLVRHGKNYVPEPTRKW